MKAQSVTLCVTENHLKTGTCVLLPLSFPLSSPPTPYKFKQKVSPFLICSEEEYGREESKYGLKERESWLYFLVVLGTKR